jgi:glucose 1-dehydrogenase
MSSVNAVFAIPDQVGYSVSKGGVNQLTKTMALSLAAYGIRVNAIGPGSIMTDMLAAVASDPAAQRRIMSRTPLGRIGDPSEVASIAAFLASDEASYMTGQTVYADGGRLGLNYTVPVRE